MTSLAEFSNVICKIDDSAVVEAYWVTGINASDIVINNLTNTQDVHFNVEGTLLAEADVDDMVSLNIVSLVC